MLFILVGVGRSSPAMTAASNPSGPRADEGFDRIALRSESLELECAPELGGRIYALTTARTRRQWMWRRPGARPLFVPGDPEDFGTGTFAGLDECLPTVAADRWIDGRSLPDHGAVWARRWTVVDCSSTSLDLRVDDSASALRLERRIELRGAVVRFDYRLENLSDRSAPALWAMHPLFALRPGDQLALPKAIQTLRVEAADPSITPRKAGGAGYLYYPEIAPGVRLDHLVLPDPAHGHLKCFSEPLLPADGWASLLNRDRGERLLVRWDTQTAPYLGLWLSRGGYRGWHQVAIEPTNANGDKASEALTATDGPDRVLLPAQGIRRWWVEWDLAARGPLPV